MGEKNTNITLCILILLLLTMVTIGQGLVLTSEGSKENPVSCNLGRGGSVQVWQDDFHDGSKIDSGLSDHIVVNMTAGTIIMDNTYAAWTDPTFTRMKPIFILNSGQETFQNYDVNLTVSYDTDMQPDFDDLRFTDINGIQLSYFIISKTNSISCKILVKVPTLAPGQTTFYMFYGNPAATGQSSFSSIFSWRDRTRPDTMVSFKSTTEGAWDPDVIYGANRFLITWEERNGPEDIGPNHYERTFPGVIHGRTYNIDGLDPVPTNNSDIDISDPSTTYHAENPCNAFGDGKFFVVWEENPANEPLNRFETDIKGALVTPAGGVNRFTICSVAGTQLDPQVAYDSLSNRFLVVWADARNGGIFDIRGRLYYSTGYPVSADFAIAYEVNYQGNPWISSDNNGHFFIVFEDGPDSATGPFSLYAYRYDSNGNRIGSRITIAVGNTNIDYIFPAVSYNSQIGRFFVTWNDGDVSINPTIRESYDGNIWGKILSSTGSVVKDNYIIESGSSFIRTDSVPYFGTMFFVSYDGNISGTRDIYGRMIDGNGTIMTSRQDLSDGSSQNVDWNDVAVGADRILVTWEDERDQLSLYADVFQYAWRSTQTIGSTNITYSISTEKELITQAHLMSIPIHFEVFREWRQVFFLQSIPSGCNIEYDLMDLTGSVMLKHAVQNGENISDLTPSVVRLRATFTRGSPQHTPLLDKWNITALVGNDLYPPSTTINLDPAEPNGKNDWYITPVTVTFTVIDSDSDPENITTYYNINGFGVEIYNESTPPVISTNRPNNYIEYWSNDSVNEELPHHRLDGIKIDTTAPMVTIYKPAYTIIAGSTTINGSATDYSASSGINTVRISINDIVESNTSYSGASPVWFQWNFTADLGETYDIYVEVWDMAGNKIEDRRTVLCSNHGIYDPGYIYLFDNPKIGPNRILVSLGLSIAVDYDTLSVILPEYSHDAVSGRFVATQALLKKEYTFEDTNLSDGCSAELLVPLGVYQIKAFTFDNLNNQLDEYTIITKMFILTI